MATLAIRYYPDDSKPWHVCGDGATMNFYCRLNNLYLARHIAAKTRRDWYPQADIVEEFTPAYLKTRRIGRQSDI